MKFTCDYYYGNEAEQYIFYRVPKSLISEPQFKHLTQNIMKLSHDPAQTRRGDSTVLAVLTKRRYRWSYDARAIGSLNYPLAGVHGKYG